MNDDQGKKVNDTDDPVLRVYKKRLQDRSRMMIRLGLWRQEDVFLFSREDAQATVIHYRDVDFDNPTDGGEQGQQVQDGVLLRRVKHDDQEQRRQQVHRDQHSAQSRNFIKPDLIKSAEVQFPDVDFLDAQKYSREQADCILAPAQLSNYWPLALATRIKNGVARVIHIPFKMPALLDAIDQFGVANMNYPTNGYGYYNRETQMAWGLIKP